MITVAMQLIYERILIENWRNNLLNEPKLLDTIMYSIFITYDLWATWRACKTTRS